MQKSETQSRSIIDVVVAAYSSAEPRSPRNASRSSMKSSQRCAVEAAKETVQKTGARSLMQRDPPHFAVVDRWNARRERSLPEIYNVISELAIGH